MYIESLEKASQILNSIEKTRRMNEETIGEMLNGGKNQKEETIIVFYNNSEPKKNAVATA